MLTWKLMKILWDDKREPVPWLKMQNPHTEFSPYAFEHSTITDATAEQAQNLTAEDDPPAGF
jgi:hypothetical protein